MPAQDFTSAEQHAFGERLAFTPWNCTPDHRPVGGIQRARKRVYEESAKLRRGLTGAETAEPTMTDLDTLGPVFD